MGSAASISHEKGKEIEEEFRKNLEKLNHLDNICEEQIYQVNLDLLEHFKFDEVKEDIPVFTCSINGTDEAGRTDVTTEKRKIVIMVDGTGNTFNSTNQTNIALLYQILTENAEKLNQNVVVKYFSGIATQKDGLVASIDNAIAISLNKMILKVYRFICEQYQDNEKDELIFFGFSRGSYIIRILVCLLRWKGIPRSSVLSEKEKEEMYEKVLFDFIEVSRQHLLSSPHKISPQLNNDEYLVPTITFLGLFDTVPCIPTSVFDNYDCFFHLEDTIPVVKSACHIMATNIHVLFQNLSYFSFCKNDLGFCVSIEEKPFDFETLKYKVGKYYEYRTVGDHCNVGGSWIQNPKQEKALSNNTFRQMLKASPFYELEASMLPEEYPTVKEEDDPQKYTKSFTNIKDLHEKHGGPKPMDNVYIMSEEIFGKKKKPNQIKKVEFPVYSFC
jgi:hypothetical protein